MSMISAQIDALRRMADGQATYRDARAVMLQAADTIAELQKDLEFANNECEKESIEFLNLQAENAKLREEAKRQSGAGTCEADETDLIPFVRADSDGSDVDYIHVMECNSCGGTYEHVNGSYEFCPRCGRKVVNQ